MFVFSRGPLEAPAVNGGTRVSGKIQAADALSTFLSNI